MEGSTGMDLRFGVGGAEAAEDPARPHSASVTATTTPAALEDNGPAPDGLIGGVAGKHS